MLSRILKTDQMPNIFKPILTSCNNYILTIQLFDAYYSEVEHPMNTNIEYHYLVPTIQIVRIIRDNTAPVCIIAAR